MIANFGQVKKEKTKVPHHREEHPIHRLNIEYVTEQLKRIPVGTKASKNGFFGEVTWGEGPGAVRVVFSPYGGVRATIRKFTHNLKGEGVWVCKKVMTVRHLYDDRPDAAVVDLQNIALEADQGSLDSPIADYKGLEKLVLKMAKDLAVKHTQKFLMFEGVRRISPGKEYIIHFAVGGMGVQRADQKRLDKFCVYVKYDETAGVIEVNGIELGDKLGSHRWVFDPSEFIETFMPSQPEKEIIQAVLTHLNNY